ncbi:MAG: hypothetical protein ABJA98_29080 [Acidobacteriota bacterium]
MGLTSAEWEGRKMPHWRAWWTFQIVGDDLINRLIATKGIQAVLVECPACHATYRRVRSDRPEGDGTFGRCAQCPTPAPALVNNAGYIATTTLAESATAAHDHH